MPDDGPLELLQLDADLLDLMLATLPPRSLTSVAKVCTDLRRVVGTRLASVSRLCQQPPVWASSVELGEGKMLHLSGRNMGSHGAELLAEALARVEMPLSELNLNQCSLGDAGMQAVFGPKTAGRTASLEFLYLHDNRIGAAGTCALASAAAGGSLPKLQVLNLSENPLGSDGAAALADAISRGSFARLVNLGLTGCGCGDEGARALGPALCADGAMAKLEWLLLGGNRIGDAGARAFAAALGASPGAMPAVEWLCLNDNKIGGVGGAALARAIVNGALPACTRRSCIGLKNNLSPCESVVAEALAIASTDRDLASKACIHS